MRKVYLYARFQRFWHWMQALIIFSLLVTGLEVHGLFHLLGYEAAFHVHNAFAWGLVLFILLAFFWYITTGDFRQYLTEGNLLEKIMMQARYYMVGIFKNEPHPFKKNEISRLNPLQRITYLMLTLVGLPLQIIVGFAYYYYNELVALGMDPDWIEPIAVIHTLLAYLLIGFVIMHVYMTTTGHTLTSNIKAMVTGWEEVEE
ncbi:cytochrome b/b6 domain-containing protein [Prosthecochloris sp. N3]|uniref:Cytochrome b/b6 domain-containing protein n=1 Tax=Prosthecochloris ethylica TaxID=2743976 RepID=A0ABR9XTD0_9CHLB|nr:MULTISPECIES: cytochrome b/b6 domain-containing protein [Prosthecochloris]MEC9486016.1 cytochrome b/b6 domain-containing protein [Prosthecochloris sp.]MBF0587233.1 cytochrome b/b6 domain-containing protein [Prosthecochloris ethylica]MBF0637306.1 cytochrome b/b6 domain-containing protein [Prosthecochloris ethylica]NUK48395.1 cytochrome b/b6 domain-containing protein [Prosthecochloris ethylica]RNA65601.1 cytochrome B [Prosthecochloris sp. ZM_2]